MVAVIFRARAKAGKEDEAAKAMTNMANNVKAQEPGALAYICHRMQDDPGMFVVFETYADDAAFQAHMATPHMGEMRAAFGDLFDGSEVKLDRLDRVGGFSRDS